MAGTVKGSHLLGGYISYKSTNGGQVEVTVNLLADSNSSIKAGGGILAFGDVILHPLAPSEFSVVPFGPNVNLATYSTSYVYDAHGVYEIFYSEPNYSQGINNMVGSSLISFYVSSTLTIDPVVGENSSPVLNLFQGQLGAAGKQQRMNPAPFDPDSDSLSYELIIPGKDRELRIKSYTHPNDTAFYTDYLSRHVSIEPPESQCYNDQDEIGGQFILAALNDEPITVKVLPGDVFPEPIVPEEVVREFVVYPNPTFQHSINVVLPENTDKPRNIKIINSTGKVIYNQHAFFSKKMIFDLSGLTSGIYIIYYSSRCLFAN